MGAHTKKKESHSDHHLFLISLYGNIWNQVNIVGRQLLSVQQNVKDCQRAFKSHFLEANERGLLASCRFWLHIQRRLHVKPKMLPPSDCPLPF